MQGYKVSDAWNYTATVQSDDADAEICVEAVIDSVGPDLSSMADLYSAGESPYSFAWVANSSTQTREFPQFRSSI